MVCAMVSIQPFTCPVSDTEETIRIEGSFQVLILGVDHFVENPFIRSYKVDQKYGG
jgi:hypothetical protein